MRIKTLLLVVIVWLTLCLSAQEADGYTPGDQSLLLLPTAYTMPKGKSSFTDYEILIIQYAYAPTNSTHISALSILPFFKEYEKSITLGVKQRYLKMGVIQSADFGSYTPDSQVLTLGNVFSIGKPSQSLHLGAFYAWNEKEGRDYPVIIAGARKYLNRKTAFMIEYGTILDELKEDFTGLYSFGFRFIKYSIAWDIGGIRNTADTIGSLFFIPIIKATFEF
jgi:hypothetical protein